MRLRWVPLLLCGLLMAVAHGALCPASLSRNTCPAAGTALVYLDGCNMGDGALPELSSCFDQIGRSSIEEMYLGVNGFTDLPVDLFSGFTSMTSLSLFDNVVTTFPAGIFSGLTSLTTLDLTGMGLTALPESLFSGTPSLTALHLDRNYLAALPESLFSGLSSLSTLVLSLNSLTTLPEGLFSGLTSMTTLSLDLTVECVPSNGVTANPEGDICQCTLSDDILCGDGKVCTPGNDVNPGYTCATSVDPDAGTEGDPHMIGLRGQKIDWKGEDGGWYALLSDAKADFLMSVRLTAPLPVEYPDRQLMTGFAMSYQGGHSVVIEIKDPYTTEASGCPKDMHAPCLSENALRLMIDGEEQLAVPTEDTHLEGGAKIMASNLPAECRPYGGDAIWADTFSNMAVKRHLAADLTLDEWVLGWSPSTAAPAWCEKFIADFGTEGLLDLHNKHTVFNIETPHLTVRLHSGTNYQGGEVLEDGRTLPHLEFWQMDVHIEYFDLNTDTVTGILGETIRPVLDATGQPIMSGSNALRGEVEDFHISGPLMSDFDGLHEEG